MSVYEAYEKGGTVILTKKWLIEKFGEEAVSEILSKLGDETRDMFEFPDNGKWYSQRLIRELYEAIDSQFSKGDPDFFRDFGRYDADTSTKGPLRFLLRMSSGKQLLKRSKAFMKHYFKGTTLDIEDYVEEEGHCEVILVLNDFDEGRPGCRIMEGYYQTVFTKAGCKNMVVEKKTCIHEGDNRCAWRLSWDE